MHLQAAAIDRRRMPRRYRCLVLPCLLVLPLGLAGCRRSELASCTALLDAGNYADAARRCEQVYAAEHEPRAGNAAARAHYYLGHPDDVLAWTKRLAGSEGERGLWSLVAATHRRRGETHEAELAFRRDLALARAAGDAEGMARPLYGLFFLAWSDSRYREALRFAADSYAQAAEAGDRAAQGRAAEGLYTVLYEVGDRVAARRALEMAAALTDEQTPLERARFLANDGVLLRAEGRPRLGALRLEQAIGTGCDDHRVLRSAHLDLVEAYLEAGRVDDAEHHLRAAWTHAEPQASRTALLHYQAAVDLARGRLDAAEKAAAEAVAGDPVPEWAWELEHVRGRIAEARGDRVAAESAYTRSIDHVETMRRALGLGELKAWLLDDKRRPFESLFLLRARAGRARDALATAERAQARTLLDTLIQAAGAGTGAPAAKTVETAADRLEALQALMPAMSASPVAALLPLPRVLAGFGDRHALAYFTAGEEVWLSTVSHGAVQAWPLAKPAAAIRAFAEDFAARPEDAGLAASFADLLLPTGALPPPGATIYIVADGALAQVPFGALRIPPNHRAQRGRYLVEDHALVYVPSLTALVAIESRKAAALSPPVVLADAGGDLPGAAAEALAVARAASALVRTASRATTRELDAAAHATLLHLATHGGLGPRGPWLALADRRVGAGDIVTRRIAPRLVVLGSCAAAARERREMWGSLAAAFLAAGSRAVVASTGSVDDEAARRFLLRFYAAGGAADPAIGLARAQRAAIAAGEPASSWAPFALYGQAVSPAS